MNHGVPSTTDATHGSPDRHRGQGPSPRGHDSTQPSTQPSTQRVSTLTTGRLYAEGGEMGARVRAFDWSRTALGPIAGWPQSLRTTVDTMLGAPHPMFLWWGPELIQIYNDGYTPSLGPDRHPGALGARGPECWAEIWPIIGPEITAIMVGGAATWHEDNLVPITRNGRVEEVYWTYSYSPVRDDDGGVGGVLVVVQETTARVMSERRLRVSEERLTEVFRQAPAFICVLRGPEHMFEMANDSYYQLVGFRELIGKPVRDALPDAEGQGYFELLDNVLATGEAFVGRELPLVLQRTPGAPQEQRFVTFVYQALTEQDGSRSGIFVHGVDVTEQVRARAEVDRARRAAEEANAAKTQFLATMSHELRTPLNAIGGYVQLLEMGVRGPITPAQRDDLTRVRIAQEHLLGLINSVLNYARLEAGAIQYSLTAVPVAQIVAAVEALVAPQIRSRQITYSTDTADAATGAAPLCVQADSEKLRQILVNLLMNAIKFTPVGGRVSITVDPVRPRDDEADEQDLGHVTVRVTDTGVGIAADRQDSIFDPFVQVGRRLTSTDGGVGLGLSISRDLARGMGGDLTVESEVGRGSSFALTLARALPAAPAVPTSPRL